jgi:hypothetical protein
MLGAVDPSSTGPVEIGSVNKAGLEYAVLKKPVRERGAAVSGTASVGISGTILSVMVSGICM